ncbi:DNA polymerase I [SAR86 cluster bacterium]|nr:DNA polymerase I [SAR86 cluster bacterium]
MIFRPDVILIDGSSYIYRAFHALPPLTTTAGKPTGATRGFASMLRKLIDIYPGVPMVMIFDAKGPNFRNDFFKDYKSNRPPMPNELRVQIDDIKTLSKLFKMNVLEIEGVEADDVIATLAKDFNEKKILISSPDKDLTQLVEATTIQHNSMTNDFFDVKGVYSKFGVLPNKIAELLAIVGDKSDNIPGITKVGTKTAAKWIEKYGSLDSIIDNAKNISGVVGENLRNELSNLKRNLFLVSLKNDLKLNLNFDDLQIPENKNQKLKDFYLDLEFNAFIESAEKSKKDFRYLTVSNQDELDKLEAKLLDSKYFAFDTETNSLNQNEASIVGASFSVQSGEGFYLPINHVEQTKLNRETLLSWLKNVLEKNVDKIIGQNLKFDLSILKNEKIELSNFYADTMLMSYVINSTLTRHNLDALCEKYLGRQLIKFEEVMGKGKNRYKNFGDVPIKDATAYAAEDAEATFSLFQKLSSLIDEDARKLLKDVEYPLVFVLMNMEREGTMIDIKHLKKLSNHFGSRLMSLVQKIYEVSETRFNIDSPKQLSEVLFEKLCLPTQGLKKTSSGYYSTSEAILQKLSHDHEIVKDILEYRSLAKLKSTYTDKLSEICDARSRVHTSYQQAVTSTGRLSSSEPNLQNIPIRTNEGITIREAFVAPKGSKILAIDYSQIELRLMAHYSKDDIMIDAFNNNEDIHKRTASEVFGVDIEDVTGEMRRNAKTINFGLLYGMSAFGLSNQLGVSRAEAEIFLQNYFDKYSKVRSFMETTTNKAKKNKFVTTLYGRKIHVPNIESPNYMLRQASERAAINGPLQGSAADIIKVAMVSINRWISENRSPIKLLLQVHDELLFEVPENYVEKDIQSLVNIMEETTLIDVPLVAEYGFGTNWREAH